MNRKFKRFTSNCNFSEEMLTGNCSWALWTVSRSSRKISFGFSGNILKRSFKFSSNWTLLACYLCGAPLCYFATLAIASAMNSDIAELLSDHEPWITITLHVAAWSSVACVEKFNMYRGMLLGCMLWRVNVCNKGSRDVAWKWKVSATMDNETILKKLI